MRDTQECLAKAAEMLDAAQSSYGELAVVYRKLASDWYLLARQAEWTRKYLYRETEGQHSPSQKSVYLSLLSLI